jgi:hypothetical protein
MTNSLPQCSLFKRVVINPMTRCIVWHARRAHTGRARNWLALCSEVSSADQSSCCGETCPCLPLQTGHLPLFPPSLQPQLSHPRAKISVLDAATGCCIAPHAFIAMPVRGKHRTDRYTSKSDADARDAEPGERLEATPAAVYHAWTVSRIHWIFTGSLRVILLCYHSTFSILTAPAYYHSIPVTLSACRLHVTEIPASSRTPIHPRSCRAACLACRVKDCTPNILPLT